MTHRFDFLIRSSKEMPGPKFAQVYVKTPQKNSDGHILVTPDMTISQIDSTINQLILELKEIRKEAKKELEKEV